MMWASQGHLRPNIIVAAFGEQRSYRSSSGGGRGGGGRGGRGGRGQNRGPSQRWNDDFRQDGRDRNSNDSYQRSSGRGGGRGGGRGSGNRFNSDRNSNYSSKRERDEGEWRGGYESRNDNFYNGDEEVWGNQSDSYSEERFDGGGHSRSGGRYGDRDNSNRYERDRKSESNTPSIKDLWIGDVVYGVSPVLAALEAGRRSIHTLYVQEGVDASKRKDKGAVATATARAKELGANVLSASKHDLNMISENRPHQGLILDASALDFENLDAMPAAEEVWDEEKRAADVHPPVWLCLDEVVDPQNFGAALRSAFFLGASGVLTCRRNSAPLSPIVSKSSAGALELMPVHSCRSLPQTLADARERGWTVIGAAAQSDAISCSQYVPSGPTILVMGNEGYGLRTTVRHQCDTFLRIDGGNRSVLGLGGIGAAAGERAKRISEMVDSLNVSVATGILMHQLLAPIGK